jgi:hypothetical protein
VETDFRSSTRLGSKESLRYKSGHGREETWNIMAKKKDYKKKKIKRQMKPGQGREKER